MTLFSLFVLCIKLFSVWSVCAVVMQACAYDQPVKFVCWGDVKFHTIVSTYLIIFQL